MTFLTQEDSAVFYDLKQTLLASPVSANEKHPARNYGSVFGAGKLQTLWKNANST